jgi:outer membrane protein assembly factor BamB
MQIDAARRGKMPPVAAPSPFRGKDGRVSGWRVEIPGSRPLATPAVVDGRVFLGGGFGSYEFYAFDADTGNLLWQYQTTDDGPTAAVVQDDYVVVNTESCELEVLTVKGKPVWKRWLGDPLMSMPAVAKGRVYMAYPDTRNGGQHYVACFDLESGNPFWRSPISGEIITAPVLADDRIYLTTLDGTLYCFVQCDGELLWQEAKNATSAPAVLNGQCYFSQREEVQSGDTGRERTYQTEHCSVRGPERRSPSHAYRATSRRADYLDHEKRKGGSPLYRAYEAADGAVGFAFSKGSAKIEQAIKNLGHAQVSAIWAYQGSKPFLANRCMYSPMGDTLHCVDLGNGQVLWQKKLCESSSGEQVLDNVLTPPALVNGKVFVATSDGAVQCLSACDGTVIWSANVGEPINFQPAVARGRVYVATKCGSLFCLETGDAGDDGWLMWGATPAHNGLPDYSFEVT